MKIVALFDPAEAPLGGAGQSFVEQFGGLEAAMRNMRDGGPASPIVSPASGLRTRCEPLIAREGGAAATVFSQQPADYGANKAMLWVPNTVFPGTPPRVLRISIERSSASPTIAIYQIASPPQLNIPAPASYLVTGGSLYERSNDKTADPTYLIEVRLKKDGDPAAQLKVCLNPWAVALRIGAGLPSGRVGQVIKAALSPNCRIDTVPELDEVSLYRAALHRAALEQWGAWRTAGPLPILPGLLFPEKEDAAEIARALMILDHKLFPIRMEHGSDGHWHLRWYPEDPEQGAELLHDPFVSEALSCVDIKAVLNDESRLRRARTPADSPSPVQSGAMPSAYREALTACDVCLSGEAADDVLDRLSASEIASPMFDLEIMLPEGPPGLSPEQASRWQDERDTYPLALRDIYQPAASWTRLIFPPQKGPDAAPACSTVDSVPDAISASDARWPRHFLVSLFRRGAIPPWTTPALLGSAELGAGFILGGGLGVVCSPKDARVQEIAS